MAEKVKVSREVAEAVKYYKTCDGIEDLITDLHFNDFAFGRKILESVNKETILAVYFGNYECEQTPEEIILENYKKAEWIVDTEEDDRNAPLINEGYLKGTKDTLDTLGIKIKGVNG